jgi:hypothetical protein
MAMHDVSKNNNRRKNPMPNTSDDVKQRMAHNTMSTSYRQDGDSTTQRIAFKNSLILTYDSDNKVSSAYGYIPELSVIPVFIIAKPGYDVFEDILGLEAPTV